MAFHSYYWRQVAMLLWHPSVGRELLRGKFCARLFCPSWQIFKCVNKPLEIAEKLTSLNDLSSGAGFALGYMDSHCKSVHWLNNIWHSHTTRAILSYWFWGSWIMVILKWAKARPYFNSKICWNWELRTTWIFCDSLNNDKTGYWTIFQPLHW